MLAQLYALDTCTVKKNEYRSVDLELLSGPHSHATRPWVTRRLRLCSMSCRRGAEEVKGWHDHNMQRADDVQRTLQR